MEEETMIIYGMSDDDSDSEHIENYNEDHKDIPGFVPITKIIRGSFSATSAFNDALDRGFSLEQAMQIIYKDTDLLSKPN